MRHCSITYPAMAFIGRLFLADGTLVMHWHVADVRGNRRIPLTIPVRRCTDYTALLWLACAPLWLWRYAHTRAPGRLDL